MVRYIQKSILDHFDCRKGGRNFPFWLGPLSVAYNIDQPLFPKVFIPQSEFGSNPILAISEIWKPLPNSNKRHRSHRQRPLQYWSPQGSEVLPPGDRNSLFPNPAVYPSKTYPPFYPVLFSWLRLINNNQSLFHLMIPERFRQILTFLTLICHEKRYIIAFMIFLISSPVISLGFPS